jgi:hypothetical protein
MSVSTTNILADVGIDRIHRIVVTRWSGKVLVNSDSMSIAYFIHVHGDKLVQWDAIESMWTLAACDSWVSVRVELKS